MICDKLINADTYYGISQNLHEALIFLLDLDFSTLNPGYNEIKGDDIYINCMQYETSEPDDKIWEAHHRYIDIHCIIDGTEKVQIADLEDMEMIHEYSANTDAALYEGVQKSEIVMTPGMFLICFPQDVHKVGIKTTKASVVKKFVCKVFIDISANDLG